MEKIVNELRQIAKNINAIADSLVEPEVKVEEVKYEQLELVPVAFEEVRKVLVEKSRQGLTSEVKALLIKYKADKLSDVDPSNYGSLLEDATKLNG